MALDQQTRDFLSRSAANSSAPPAEFDLDEFRGAVEPFRALLFDRVEMDAVGNLVVPGRSGGSSSARLYRPVSDSPPPVVVWAHGGSWVRVTVDLMDHYYRFIAARSGCAVLAVEYRLSPESTFPGAIHEVLDCAGWIRDHGAELGCDPSRLAVAGESSGGNLAAAATLSARDSGVVGFDHQLLVAPVLDAAFESESWQRLGQDFLLTADQLRWALEQYAPGVDHGDPLISPLRASRLDGLPAATIVVGEYDPLRDDGHAYATRLRASGVDAHVIDIEGLIHHAIMAPRVLPRGHDAVAAVADALAAALAASPTASRP